ncbi:regulator of (H+)-ATPase in vacuolar membrane, partial [Tulasnella sp. 417]
DQIHFLLKKREEADARPPLHTLRSIQRTPAARSISRQVIINTVNIIDAATLSVIRVLGFWEAFPGLLGGEAVVSNVAFDQDKQLVVASLGNQVAAWVSSSTDATRWRVHTTLNIANDVMTLDCASGYLTLGISRALLEFELRENGDIPMWVKVWSTRVVDPTLVRYSPGRTLLACTTRAETAIQIFSTQSRRITQKIRQPWSPSAIAWRSSNSASNSRSTEGDLTLYTVTDQDGGTVRVYVPVLDAPNILQVHAVVDRYGFLPESSSPANGSRVFWLDKAVVRQVLEAALQECESGGGNIEIAARRKPLLQQMLDEGWDLFARILPDGSLVLRALANIDRRPPTMLKQFSVLHTPPRSVATRTPPTHLSLHFSTIRGKPTATLLAFPPFRSYQLSPLSFFDGQPSCLRQFARSYDPPLHDAWMSDPPYRDRPKKEKTGRARPITGFARTPEGDAVTIGRERGSREIWVRGRAGRLRLLAAFPPDTPSEEEHVVCIFDGGRTIALYSSESQTLFVKHFPHDPTAYPPPAQPNLPVTASIALKTTSKPVLFSLPNIGGRTPIACATPSQTILIYVGIVALDDGSKHVILTLQPTKPLPVAVPPEWIMPVDPMSWNPPSDAGKPNGPLGLLPKGITNANRDAFVSISPEGELSFWSAVMSNGNGDAVGDLPGWRCTGRVRTQRKKIVMAQCSSAKKTVLVVDSENGQEVTIWDSKESEFSSGLEYLHSFKEKINDLDWTSTYDSLSILALGFEKSVHLLCPQRMSYFDERPTWGTLHVIDIASMSDSIISDSIWLSQGALLVAAAHQLYVFGEANEPFLATSTSTSGPLFENVAMKNGPLDDFHPQLMLQCLLWNKVDLVKDIITLLAHNITSARSNDPSEMKQLPLDRFWEDDLVPSSITAAKRSLDASALFNHHGEADSDAQDMFSRELVDRLVRSLEDYPLPHLTPSEMEHLIVLIQTTVEIDEQRRSLDANGVRYLISMRSFFIINRRVTEEGSGDATPGSKSKKGVLAPFVRERIRYRDIVWAFHSESQEILLSASTAACGGKMLWLDARALGVFLWGKSVESLRDQMEVIARNQYMASERDPSACCMFYFALGKVKLVHGLWKQAAWHKEQPMMLKFLSNDFSQPRWQTAALKNAFALLSKQRYEYAAAFFLLGGSLKDAVNVCLKQLADFQLAVALARVVEGDDGPVLQNILKDHVIARAFRNGNRWLGSWAYWMLNRRDMAVRILLTPLQDLAGVADAPLDEIGDPHYDDPSLAVLFAQLKSKSLQTVKGCHVLAIDLVRSWSFDRPVLATPAQPKDIADTLDERLLEVSEISARLRPSPVRERSASSSRPPASPTLRKSFARLQR